MPIFSKKDLEGYVKIDHRESPGFNTPQEAAEAGRKSLLPYVGAGKLFEGATITCSHCQRVFIKNPDRVRTRGYCPKCDHFICDPCELERVRSGGACTPFKKIIDAFREKAAKGVL